MSVAIALLLVAGIAGCRKKREASMNLPARAVALQLGRRVLVGGAWLHYASSSRNGKGELAAELGASSSDAALSNQPWITATLEQGEALPAFGAIHRLHALGHEELVLTIEPAGDLLARGSLVLTPSGMINLPVPGGHDGPAVAVVLREVRQDSAGRASAHLGVYRGDSPIYAVPPAQFAGLEVVTGDAVSAHGLRYRVLAVRAADANRGLPAWVELTASGTP